MGELGTKIEEFYWGNGCEGQLTSAYSKLHLPINLKNLCSKEINIVHV